MPAPRSLLELFKLHPAELSLNKIIGVAMSFRRNEIDERRVASHLLSDPANFRLIYGGDVGKAIAGARRAVVLRRVIDVLMRRLRFSSNEALEITERVFELSPEHADELYSVLNQPRGKRGRGTVASFLERHGVRMSFPSPSGAPPYERLRRGATKRSAVAVAKARTVFGKAALDKTRKLAEAKREQVWLREQARAQRELAWSKRCEDAERKRLELFAARQARREADLLKEPAKTEKVIARKQPAQSAVGKKKLVGVGSVAYTRRLLVELKQRALKKD